MNPILAWLLQHNREDWTAPQTRANYDLGHYPPSTDAEWRSGLARAYQAERVQRRLDEARGNQRIETVLRGVLALGDVLTIPVQLRGRTAQGAEWTETLYVSVHRDERVSDLRNNINRAVVQASARYDLVAWSFDVQLGAYSA